ncbi:ATP-binding protein [Massilia sp. GCM10020059]|uniref:histidine kinase n=1 Tax=Massilia agrisoli TaxID=2892444 RepID=A0ABS8IWI8_9BURK|nr:PAS domain-containing sensor histidine kinase [Massilia agrisoli]MCC6072992.1 PAS domain-containing sensor histidine kinase [Massilia agrisoli]
MRSMHFDCTMLDAQCTSYQSPNGEINAQLFQVSLDCIKVISLDGYIVQVNPGAADALELDSIDDICGEKWVELWPEESRLVVLGAIAGATRGERIQFAAFCPTAKGTPRWWDVIVSPVSNDSGNIHGLLAVSRDVTEIYLAREALRTADVRKDEFLAILAHELRNPLSAAGMAATLLETQKLEFDRTSQLGKLIARQVGHMSRLVEDLIDISRVSRGLIVLKHEPVDMGQVVHDAMEQLQGLVDAKAHAVHLALPEQPCILAGDRTRLLQVVGNIVGNAVRYTPAGGRIDVALSQDEDAVMLRVSDTGVGIAPERLPALFGLFTRGDRSSDRNESGLGLGLALVQKLVELHGGTVSAFSAGEGQGSCFTVSLPRLA